MTNVTGFLVRFRDNRNDETYDIAVQLDKSGEELLSALGEKIRVASDWDLQMEVLRQPVGAHDRLDSCTPIVPARADGVGSSPCGADC